MTPHNSVGQDASVAVLQQQQHQLEQGMRDLAKSVTEGFALMTAKVDRINELTTSIVAISERQAAHSDGLQRAFSEIQSVNSAVSQMVDDTTRWRDLYARSVDDRFDAVRAVSMAHSEQNAKDLASISSQISWWRGAVLGFGVMVGVLVSVCSYIGGKYVSSTEKNTESIQTMQRQIDAMPYSLNRKQVTP